MARDLRRHWAGLIGASCAIVALGVAPQPWLPKPKLQENRLLAKPPPLALATEDFAAFRKGVDAWVGDRFPARSYLVSALNFARLQIGASGSKRVIVGRGGWLFYDDGSALGAARADPPPTRQDKQAWLESLAVRSATAREAGAVYVTLVAPMKETVYPQFGPPWYQGPSRDRAAVVLSRLATASGAGEVVYPHAALAREAHWGLKVYSRHDTHWTGLGAYVAYAELMRRLETLGVAEGPRPLTDFSERHAGAPFQPRDMALMLGVASYVDVDYPELGVPGAEERLTVSHLGPRADWTGPQVIDTGHPGKPVLLIARDSFSNALMPFLYSHFSRIVATHLQDGAFRRDLIDRYKPDVVVLEVIEGGILPAGAEAGAAPPEVSARIARTIGEDRGPVLVGAPKGTPGPDTLRGGPADEVITARAGDDVVDAAGGSDTVYAGRGNDRVLGGPGDDWLSGDRGVDTLAGGPGADIFHSSAYAGSDVVTDFSAAEGDRVQLDPQTPRRIRQVGPDVVIDMDRAQLVLRGVRLATLPDGWINPD